MKKILVALVLILGIAVGGYTYLWNQKATDLKSIVEQSLTAANGFTQSVTKGTPLIKYQSLTTTGWPLNIVVEIHKPVITIPVDTVVNSIKDKNKMMGLTPPAPATEKPVEAGPAKWIETVSYDVITLGTNMKTDSFVLSFPGTQTAVTQFNNKTGSERLSTGAAPPTCTLRIAPKSSGFFDVRQAFGDGKDLPKLFRSFDCESRGVNTSDVGTKETLQTIESASFGFAFDGSNTAQSTGSLYLKMVNQKVTKAFDVMVQNYVQMINETIDPEVKSVALMNAQLSEMGNNNMEVSLNFNGPTDPIQYLSKDMVLNFGFNKFSIQNDLFKTDFEMHLKSNPAQDTTKRDTAFVVRSNSAYSERYDQLKLAEVTGMAEEFIKSDKAEMKELLEAAKRLTPEEVKLAVSDLWPRFHPLGNIGLAIDVVANTTNPVSQAGAEMTVNNFDFVTALDGIKVNGKAIQKGPMPEGEVKITCLSCEGLLARTYAYIQLLDKWAAKTDENHEVMVSNELYNGYKTFLKSISVPAKDGTGKEVATDWLYHIQMSGEKEPTLNGKPLSQVMASYTQNVAPLLSKEKEESEEHEEGSPSSTYAPDANPSTTKSKEE